MGTPLAELARIVDGRISGDGTIEIEEAATLAHAQEGEISFLDNTEKQNQLTESRATAFVVPIDCHPPNATLIHVEDVQLAFAKIVEHFRPPRYAKRIGISPAAIISPSARVGEDVDIHLGATIGDDVTIGDRATIHAGVTVMAGCQVGEDVTLFPNAVLYENTVVGARSIIHAGAVLGAYGFGYSTEGGRHHLSAQLGYVTIGNDVEIGASTTIDRGTYGPTVIGEGTKIDNLVMIAHNCRIGRHNIICSQVGIAGSTTTGDYVVMAGQVGVRDHVHIGSRAVLGAMAGVIGDIPDGECYAGIPATPMREQSFKLAALARLPEMRKQLKRLQRLVEQRENKASNSGDKNPSHAA
ncbi:MAG: UDP-3-O-(3-hydroxymyristoyl)glucosamine N-acyltransferase [Planctomycetaceae bacterium]|nr:UDP-3-O-(3-hydroxymyristoyl)glucosamine N-acyltransferase [Planctomycetaceae bacterium]